MYVCAVGRDSIAVRRSVCVAAMARSDSTSSLVHSICIVDKTIRVRHDFCLSWLFSDIATLSLILCITAALHNVHNSVIATLSVNYCIMTSATVHHGYSVCQLLYYD